MAPVAIGSPPHPDAEAVRLDGERLLEGQPVAGVVHQLEPLQDHAEHERRLDEGELAADAGPLAVAERLVGVGRAPLLGLAREVVRIEDLGALAPHRGIAVEHGREHHDLVRLLHPVRPADRGVLVGREGEDRGGGPEPQRFLQHLTDVGQLVDLGVGRRHRGVGAEDPVHLLVGAREHLRILEQEVGGEGQEAARRLVPRDQEGDHLVADVEVLEPLAALAVHAGEHAAQQIRLRGVIPALLPTLLDDPVHHLVHVPDVGLELALPVLLDQALERQAPRLHRGPEGPDHRPHERMVGIAVERVEAVAEPAQPDGVEGERRHVVGDVDLVVDVEPLPLEHQLLGDVDHHRVIALHRARPEVGQEDVVGPRPVRLLGVGGEEAVAREGAEPAQGALDALVEARLVAELVDQGEARDHHDRLAHHVEPVDGPVLARERHHVLDRGADPEREQVAQDERARGMRDRIEEVLLGHRR